MEKLTIATIVAKQRGHCRNIGSSFRPHRFSFPSWTKSNVCHQQVYKAAFRLGRLTNKKELCRCRYLQPHFYTFVF